MVEIPLGYAPAFGGFLVDERDLAERKRRIKHKITSSPLWDPTRMIYGGENMGQCFGCNAPKVPSLTFQSLGPWDAVTTEGAFIGGRKVVGMTESGSAAYTYDPATGIMWGNVWDETAGNWRSFQMPTTIAARSGGYGPIATAPTGWGRVFPAPGKYTYFSPETVVIWGPGFLTGILLGVVGVVLYEKYRKHKIIDEILD